MATNDIKRRVEKVFTECFGSEKLEQCRDLETAFNSHPQDAAIAGSDILDSLDQVEFIMALEDEFKTSIPDEKASELKSIPAVVTYLEDHVPL
ncbi:MAG: phosphopantetheine-binding protein [Rhizorhabdus sp.]